MQTIIYTNNKREGSNYEVDRVVYSEGIQVNQLIQNEMERYNISHIHFWFVRENVSRLEEAKEEVLLVNIGRYLIENKDSNFKFQYIVQKYQQNQEKKETKNCDSQSYFRNVDLSESMNEKISNKPQKMHLVREEIIKEEIKFSHFKQFQIFIKKELKSNLDQDIIKKYIFQTKDQTIGVSFFRASQKELILKIIEEDCNQIFNAKLNYRKISTIHPEDYEKNKKKMESYEKPIQLYHRVILYLFCNAQKTDETRDPKRKKTHKTNSPPPKNLNIQALQSWKTQQQVQSLIKYQKQCELITQQIENEKIIFRNKIKLIENYIGDTINVQKLFQEEEQIQTNSLTVQQMSNTMGATPLKKIPLLAKRASITPALSQTISNNLQKISKYNNSINNPSFLNVSQFKRLKDISETMRNIDNTIFEQNKKIEQLKGKAKDFMKLKQEVLFKNAKEFNSIKKQLLQLTHQIERKEQQIQQKKNNGQFQAYLQYKSKQPSQKAKQSLEEHIKFVSLHQKPQNIQTRDYVVNDYYQNKELQDKSTTRSQHRKQFKEIINSSMLRFREKKIKQAESSKQAMKTHHLSGDIGENYNKSGDLRHKASLMEGYSDKTKFGSSDLEKQLLQLYYYYLKNEQIIKQINKETGNFKCIRQQNISLIKKQSISLTAFKINNQKGFSSNNQQSQLQLDDYPILMYLLPFENCDQQCSNQTSIKTQPRFYNESHYVKDYFDIMINQRKNSSLKSCPKDESIRSSMKQTENDRFTDYSIVPKGAMPQNNVPNLLNNQKILAKPSKFKRITIEEAINTHSLLKKVRMNEK